MSDTDNTPEGTEGRKAAKVAYDPYDRKVVDPNDPSFVEGNRNRVNSGDFGFISEELATDELEGPTPKPAQAEDDA